MKASIILSAAVLFNNAAVAVKLIGCYKSSAGVTYKDARDNNSVGKCGVDLCIDTGTFALQNQKCFCGDAKPMDADKVADEECAIKCPGYPDDICT